jgi:MFS family permease
MAVVCLAGFAGSLKQVVALPLAPRLPDLVGASGTDTAWAVTATLLTGALATPVMGRLADVHGRRRLIVVALVLCTVGSAVSAVAGSLAVLLAGRALEGAAVAVVPLGVSILRDELPPRQMGLGIALVSATLGIGAGLGVPLGGVLLDRFDWHTTFWVAAATSGFAAALVVLVVPRSPRGPRQAFDPLGALTLSLALLGLLLAISKGQEWAWTGPATLTAMATTALAGPAWWLWERRQAEPLVDVTTNLQGPVLRTNLCAALVGYGMFAHFTVTVTAVSMPPAGGGFGRSLTVAGLVLLPGALGMVAFSPVSAWLSARRGAHVTLVVGALTMSAGYVLRAVADGDLVSIAATTVVISAGTGLTFGALPTLVLAHVPVPQSASANACNSVFRMVGVATASAVTGAILASATVSVGGEVLPSTDGFTAALTLGALSAAGAAALALTIGDRRDL